MSSLRWLYFDLNSFFASCEQQEHPHLRGKPVAVVPLLTDSTCAIAASYPAKAFGIKTGTPIRDALSMCPDLHVIKARPRVYVRYHQQILDAVEHCIPIHQVRSIDEMCCRLDVREREPEAARALGMKIKRTVTERVGECLTSSIGIAPNVFLAKVASNMQKPNGLTLLREEDLPQALFRLKLTDLPGIGPRMSKRLYRNGVFDMQGLWELDTLRMRAIWGGVCGLKFYEQLHAKDWNYAPTKTSFVGHQHVLDPKLRTSQGAYSTLQQLLAKAAERMRKQGYYCKRLTLEVKFANHAGYFVHDCSFAETQDTTFLLMQMKRLWEQCPPLRPLRVGISLSSLVQVQQHQLGLFDAPRNDRLMQVMDTINFRFGRGTVSLGRTNRLNEQAGGDKIAFQRVPSLYEAQS